jgi:hypothetical protein
MMSKIAKYTGLTPDDLWALVGQKTQRCNTSAITSSSITRSAQHVHTDLSISPISFVVR